MNTGFWLLDRFAVWFFDCTANPSRECLAVPPLVYMAVAVGSAAGTRLAMLRTGGGRPGSTP